MRLLTNHFLGFWIVPPPDLLNILYYSRHLWYKQQQLLNISITRINYYWTRKSIFMSLSSFLYVILKPLTVWSPFVKAKGKAIEKYWNVFTALSYLISKEPTATSSLRGHVFSEPDGSLNSSLHFVLESHCSFPPVCMTWCCMMADGWSGLLVSVSWARTCSPHSVPASVPPRAALQTLSV